MIKPGMYINDRYEIIEKVGSGGMADVYKAMCHRLNRYVAIKILKPEYSGDKNFVAKFRGEAQSAAGLSHPNIVNVYDVGDDDGLYYIVMELVEGITLKKFIERKGRLPIHEAVGIAIQICQGMEAAHANHIIHRDIKPQNIIISREGKVKVTDFGIAKAATSNTMTQNAIGSVHYLSPEQARGGYSDERSDIYSLGVTLYEMLCGKVPFVGDNTVSVALLHIQGEAVPARKVNPDVPISVDNIVQKCMQKKPERRYHNASELIYDLKCSLTDPDGDFVKISSTITNSPTKSMTPEEMKDIKSRSAAPQEPLRENRTGRTSRQMRMRREEEEELDSADTKMDRFLTVLTVFAAIILGLVVLLFVIKFFDLSSIFGGGITQTPTPIVQATVTPTPIPEDREQLVSMPRLLGLTQEEALRSLNVVSRDFVIEFSPEDYSDEYEAGQVMKQSPAAYTDIQGDMTITLTISTGPEPIDMPDVRNLSLTQAISILDANGLVPIRQYQNSDEFPADVVIDTNPRNKVKVAKGAEVIVYISLGASSEYTVMPEIRGKTLEEAEAKLTERRLIRGVISYAYSELYAKDQVCYQSFTPGKSIAPDTIVDITISLGSQSDITPQPEDGEPTTVPETPTDGPSPTPTPVFRYVGTVTVTDNPFRNAGDSGEVYFEMTKAGESTELLTRQMDYSDFVGGYTLHVEGNSEGLVYITMYVDGDPVDTWGIELAAEQVN